MKEENQIKKLTETNQRLCLIMGIMTHLLFVHCDEGDEWFKWVKKAIEEVVYRDRKLPEMPK